MPESHGSVRMEPGNSKTGAAGMEQFQVDEGYEYEGGVLFKVSRLERLTRHQIALRLAEYGLSVPAFAALNVVASHSPITNADLARASYVSPQTMNLIVAELEERNHIQRTRAGSGRGLLIELTPTGRLLFEKTLEIQAEVLAAMVGGKVADLEAFDRTLASFIANLKNLD